MHNLFEIRLCETREYSPRILEHWLHTLQKNPRPIDFLIRESENRVQLLCSEDLSAHLLGSRLIPQKIFIPKPLLFVHQKKGPLLPIKRYTQFEDRVQKTHITPLESLLPQLAKTPGAFIHIQLRPLSDRKREHILKKAKQAYFEPERRFDQWESKAWLSFKWRRFFGPIIRKSLLHSSIKTVAQEQTESLHEREDPRRAVLDKLSRPLFKTEIFLSHSFSHFIHGFTLPYLGELSIKPKPSKLIFSAEELASLLSFPNAKDHASELYTEPTAYLPMPKDLQMEEEDRKRHVYLLGKTGMGKSTLLLDFFQKDCQMNENVIIIDPHGDLIEDAIHLIPPKREKDLIILDPSNSAFPLALNPLELMPDENPSLKSSALIEMFEVLAKGSWGPRLEYILRNALLLLIVAPNTTLLDLPRLLTNEAFCRHLLNSTQDFELHRFFEQEFLAQDQKTRQEHIAPILNKVGPLLTLPILRNIFGQPHSKFSFETAFAKRRIILISLSKGKLGEDCSAMLGMIFISMIQSTLLRRADLPVKDRHTVRLTIDEFQNFTTKTLLSMLAESRKYGLALTMANQYLTQLPPEIQDAVLGNAGSLLCFRTSYADAKILAPSLGLLEEDLTHLAPFQGYAKWLKNQSPLPLFRIDIKKPTFMEKPNLAVLKQISQERYGRPRLQVEEKLKIRYNKR